MHGLEEDGSDRVGAFTQDGLFDLRGTPLTKGGGVCVVHRRAVGVGVGNLDSTRHQRFKGCAVRLHRRNSQGSHGRAVVRDVATDDLVTVGLAPEAVVLAGQLPGRLHAFATTTGEKDAIEIAGGQRSQLLGQFNGAGVGVRPNREVLEFAHLLSGHGGDIATAVSE